MKSSRVLGWPLWLVVAFGGCESAGETQPATDTTDISNFETSTDSAAATEVLQDTTPSSLCALGCLPISVDGAPLDVTFEQTNGAPPRLGGGEAPEGNWVLKSVEFFPEGAFIEGMTVEFGNAGETAGRALFGGDAMAMMLSLHLRVTVAAFGTTGTGDGRGQVTLGGCHDLEDGTISGELHTCAEGFPENAPPPAHLDYEHLGEGSLRLGVELTRDMLVSLLPVEQQASAGPLFIGSLRLIATFTRP